MPSAVIEGTVGSVTLPTGHNAKLNHFSVTVGQGMIDITGFDSAGWMEMLGTIKSLSGSARGRILYNAAATDPGFTAMTKVGASITLLFTNAGGSPCSLTFTGIVSNISSNEDAHGDVDITFNFVSTGAVTSAWDIT